MSRSTRTNSRLPFVPILASILQRSVAYSSGQVPSHQWRSLVQRADLPLQQRQVVHGIEDEILLLIRARSVGR